MQQWEYLYLEATKYQKIGFVADTDTEEPISTTLEKLGLDGWELVGVTTGFFNPAYGEITAFTLFFKRPKE